MCQNDEMRRICLYSIGKGDGKGDGTGCGIGKSFQSTPDPVPRRPHAPVAKRPPKRTPTSWQHLSRPKALEGQAAGSASSTLSTLSDPSIQGQGCSDSVFTARSVT